MNRPPLDGMPKVHPEFVSDADVRTFLTVLEIGLGGRSTPLSEVESRMLGRSAGVLLALWPVKEAT